MIGILSNFFGTFLYIYWPSRCLDLLCCDQCRWRVAIVCVSSHNVTVVLTRHNTYKYKRCAVSLCTLHHNRVALWYFIYPCISSQAYPLLLAVKNSCMWMYLYKNFVFLCLDSYQLVFHKGFLQSAGIALV